MDENFPLKRGKAGERIAVVNSKLTSRDSIRVETRTESTPSARRKILSGDYFRVREKDKKMNSDYSHQTSVDSEFGRNRDRSRRIVCPIFCDTCASQLLSLSCSLRSDKSSAMPWWSYRRCWSFIFDPGRGNERRPSKGIIGRSLSNKLLPLALSAVSLIRWASKRN